VTAEDESAGYNWSTPSARQGVAFSEWGVRIAVEGEPNPKSIRLSGTAGEYRVAFVHRGASTATTECRLPVEGWVEVEVPARPGEQVIDAVEVVPSKGAGIRQITQFEVIRRSGPAGAG
jgi:hypothetical protein